MIAVAIQPRHRVTIPRPDQREDPRLALAKWVTSNPCFAQATVNRMWSYFFGRGMIEPVDDFRSTSPPRTPRSWRRWRRTSASMATTSSV
jgi:Protein of unknown function (DUF1553)